MKEVINIIKQLQNTSSSNEKLNILKLNKDNELLQKVLEYTYNPFKKYNKSKKSISLRVYPQNNINDIFSSFTSNNTSNSSDFSSSNFDFSNIDFETIMKIKNI